MDLPAFYAGKSDCLGVANAGFEGVKAGFGVVWVSGCGLECVLAFTGDLMTYGSFRLVWCLVVVEGLFCHEGRQLWRT